MHYSPEDLYVGAIENTPNCSTVTAEQNIWSKFMLMILLQGSQRFVIDGVPFHLDAGRETDNTPLVFMLNVAKPSTLRFVHESQVPLRKVMIAAPTPWLKRLVETQSDASTPALRRFFSEHLARFSFAPGRSILQQAEKIMHPPPVLEGELNALYLRAQALDIMWQSCLTMIAEGSPEPQTPCLMSLRTGERIKDFILANLDTDLTIERIAHEAGASPSTVQRNFKEQFGTTIFEFVRQKRLETAYAALVNDGLPIAQAAHLAGYNNVSSFTTAFRKTYGMTPKQVRA